MASPSPRCTPRKLRRIMSSKPAGPADRQERGCPTGTDKRWEGVAMAAAEPFESHVRGALLNLVRGGSEESFFTVLDADGSKMSGAPMAERLHLNRTIGFEPQDGEADAPMFGGYSNVETTSNRSFCEMLRALCLFFCGTQRSECSTSSSSAWSCSFSPSPACTASASATAAAGQHKVSLTPLRC